MNEFSILTQKIFIRIRITQFNSAMYHQTERKQTNILLIMIIVMIMTMIKKNNLFIAFTACFYLQLILHFFYYVKINNTYLKF